MAQGIYLQIEEKSEVFGIYVKCVKDDNASYPCVSCAYADQEFCVLIYAQRKTVTI